ncbi:MAG: hypothetical protein JSS75_04485 [Bacteroidetes bacterium]|nr:hypothetical protein [Bacteroidota bacterium]
MITTLAILLYLGQIFGSAQYTPEQIDSIIQANQDDINLVEQNQSLVNSINVQYDSTAVIVYTNSNLKP